MAAIIYEKKKLIYNTFRFKEHLQRHDIEYDEEIHGCSRGFQNLK
jgi:hypothetical protein